MKQLAVRGALAFSLPVLAVFAFSAAYAMRTGQPQNSLFLAAGPLCGIAGGLAYGRRWGLPIVLALCFGVVGVMFSLQEIRSPWFSDVVWTAYVSAFLFWVAGGCAMLAIPAEMRFNGAAALAIPGFIAGFAFQFLYGPAHFLFNVGSPWEHFALWLIAGAGSGWLLGRKFGRPGGHDKSEVRTHWPLVSIACGVFGLGIGVIYFLRASLPLGLFNSVSPIAAAADWLWGWGLLTLGIGIIAATKRTGRKWVVLGLGLATVMLVASFRIDANPWKTQFNSKYAAKLLRDHPDSGDAIYTGNLVLAQVALDNNDITSAKRYLAEAASTPGARAIEQNGLDVSVVRALYDRGERDAVVAFLERGRMLWPQGAPVINRWQAAIKAGRRPNFNNRNINPLGGQ